MLYAIGDIHGECGMLEELLNQLPLEPDDRLIFIGDYIDRGPDSKGVVDCLVEVARERACTFLMGNHESMFLDFIGWHGEAYFGGDAFLVNGGDRESPEPEKLELPKEHEDFYRSLKLFHLEGDYLFVHAGIGCQLLGEDEVGFALRRSRPEDLLWDRASTGLPHALGVTIVYGHTPAPGLAVRWNPPFSIGIDTGAVFGGRLTAIRLPDETIFQV
jgi:serine/threonine protein phosphatase 1